MPLLDDPGAFETAFCAAVAAALPDAIVERVARTIVAIKLRVNLDDNRFLDVFFNARNRRTDLTLVKDGHRVFGYDNLGGWHRHPPEAPDRHDVCPEPGLEAFVREAMSLAQAQ